MTRERSAISGVVGRIEDIRIVGVRLTLALLATLCMVSGCATARISEDESARFRQVYSLPIRGSESSPVSVLQYSSFTCAHCKPAFASLSDLISREPALAKVIFKPVAFAGDAKAKEAAKAALAASLQGKFWEMSAKLFEHQEALDAALYPKLAAELGLDGKLFAEDMKAPFLDRAVELMTQQAFAAGIQGTPSFFINQYLIGGNFPEEKLKQAITYVRDGKDPAPIFKTESKKGAGKKKR